MQTKKATLLRKALAEINHFKANQLIWDDISYKNLAKHSKYSYKQFMKIVDFVKEHNLAKFCVSLNYPLIGAFTGLIFVRLKKQSYSEKFKNIVKDLDFVQDIYFIGEMDTSFILRIRVLSYRQVQEFTDILREKTKDLMMYTSTSLIHKTFLDEGKIFQTDRYDETVELDKIDFEIIKLLHINAHFPLSALAKRTELREPTIHRRIKKLKDLEVITGYHYIRNWQNIPQRYWPITAICTAHTDVGFDYNALLNIPSVKSKNVHIKYIYVGYGIYHLIIGISAKNMHNFRKFVYDELVSIPGLLDVKPFLVLEGVTKPFKFFPTYSPIQQ